MGSCEAAFATGKADGALAGQSWCDCYLRSARGVIGAHKALLRVRCPRLVEMMSAGAAGDEADLRDLHHDRCRARGWMPVACLRVAWLACVRACVRACR